MAGQRATDFDARIGARIALARRAAGITQEQMAGSLGVSKMQVAKYEAGTNRIAASTHTHSFNFIPL